MNLPDFIIVSQEVSQALDSHKPVVALESTVITHGLPYPDNLHLARRMESEVRTVGAIPAAVAVLDGKVHVGVSDSELERLATDKKLHKVSVRDIAPLIASRQGGGTTVAGTLFVAHAVGIRLFATGGIGGVHRQAPFDISADLVQLSRAPLIVVCAGAKAILDLPATLEVLETFGVPVIGYQTDEFPAFYARSSGLPLSARADTPEQVAAIAIAHWQMGLRSAVLVAQPPPDEVALPAELVDAAVQQALQEAEMQHIRGQPLTPFLLSRVNALTGGQSLQANLALLVNNARLAAKIALAM